MQKTINNIQYRPMQKADIQKVVELESTVSDGQSQSAITNALNNSSNMCFVATQKHVLCGFCSYTLVQDTANLDSLTVHTAYRRQKIGMQILQYSMQQLQEKGVNVFWLEVRSKNESAINLYKLLNFKQNGLRKNFYKNPSDDAVLMEYVKQK